MDYKINQFNLTDVNFSDLKELAECFETSIPSQKISFCTFGPNILLFNGIDGKLKKTEEDRKILNAQCLLLLSSMNSGREEENGEGGDNGGREEINFCYSMSTRLNKIYLKRFLKEITTILKQQSTENTQNQTKNTKKPNKKNNKNTPDLSSIFKKFTIYNNFKRKRYRSITTRIIKKKYNYKKII